MSLKARTRALAIASCVYLLFALATCGIRLYAMQNLVDPATGFLLQSAPWYSVSLWAFAIITLVFFAFCLVVAPSFCTRKEQKEPQKRPDFNTGALTVGTQLVFSRDSLPRIFISAFCGFALISFSVLSLMELSLSLYEVLLNVLAIPTGLFFLLQYTRLLPLYSLRRTLLSLCPVLWGVFGLALQFMTSSRVASGEYHNWQIVALISLPLFFYLQTLFTTPNRGLYRYGAFLAVSVVGAALILIFTLPTLLLANFWYYSAFRLYTNLYALMILLCFAPYFLVFAFSSLNGMRKIDDVAALRDGQSVPTQDETETSCVLSD